MTPEEQAQYRASIQNEIVDWEPGARQRSELSDSFERIRGGKFPAYSKNNNCNICPVRFVCAQRMTSYN